ncbi:MAG: phytanoyl-CoA dioxygenase family protein [Proteobacteria bacterium]|nr:phytanoyl-CoA dioxygenase family protein [Pseudomonadota bacterium]
MALQTLKPDAGTGAFLEAMNQDGAVIVCDLLDDAARKQMTDEVMPFIVRTPHGNDDFVGRKTQRTGALVARTPACRGLVMRDEVLGTAREFLSPFSRKIILHLTQTIYIHPGQGAQPLHRDRLAWGTYLPPDIEPQFNTIWALTDFSARNGATRVVPGSHRWAWEQRAAPEQICQAEMSAGSVLFYSGSVLHSGGENRSDQSRLGLNITYCLGWLRQEENQYLSCPPHIARDLDPELQELLGYTQGDYALGYFSDPDSSEPGREILPPEMALGRMPRRGQGRSLSDLTSEGLTADQLNGDQI